METNRYILLHTGYGDGPMETRKRKEILKIHLFKNHFYCDGHDYRIRRLKYYRDGVFKIEYFGKDTDFCFKPKWYQYPKIVLYYAIRFISKNVVSIMPKVLSWMVRLVP